MRFHSPFLCHAGRGECACSDPPPAVTGMARSSSLRSEVRGVATRFIDPCGKAGATFFRRRDLDRGLRASQAWRSASGRGLERVAFTIADSRRGGQNVSLSGTGSRMSGSSLRTLFTRVLTARL